VQTKNIMDILSQYNFYTSFKREIEDEGCDTSVLTTLLYKHAIKFDKKIYDMFIETINKSTMKKHEKIAMKMFIFYDE